MIPRKVIRTRKDEEKCQIQWSNKAENLSNQKKQEENQKY
jgi:hypothetical protein